MTLGFIPGEIGGVPTMPVGILLVFAFMAWLMITRRLSVIWALPLTAAAIAAVGGLGVSEILRDVIESGASRLSGPIITVMFGAVLAQQVKDTGIAETIVRYAAELAGDKPFVVAVSLGIMTMLLFSVLGGLGAIIMVGSIALPVMISVGITPLAAGCMFLFGISFGGIFNLVNWTLYIDIFGLDQAQVLSFALPLFAVAFLVYLAFAWRQTRVRAWGWAEQPSDPEPDARARARAGEWLLGPLALLTPVIPILLILPFAGYKLALTMTQAAPERIAAAFTFPFIPAFVAGILFGFIATFPRGRAAGLLPWNWFGGYGRAMALTGHGNEMMRAVFEGIRSVVPAMALMIGVGMLVTATMHPNVVQGMSGVLTRITPTSPALYVIGFGVLAPLSLYRGPLNIWGMGFGIGQLLVESGSLARLPTMGMLLSVGQVQGACDPTNTHNVWVASFLKLDVNDILKKSLPWIWAVAVLGLGVSAVMFLR